MPDFKFDPQKPFDIAQDKHHRKSIRLKGFDYSQTGAYFVTLVTYQRDPLFGKIENEIMVLNDFGKIADECWRAIPNHFPFVELGAHVVMPNHAHGVIVINDMGDGTGRGDAMRRPYANHHAPHGAKTGFIGRNHWVIQIRRFVSNQQGIQRHRHLATELL